MTAAVMFSKFTSSATVLRTPMVTLRPDAVFTARGGPDVLEDCLRGADHHVQPLQQHILDAFLRIVQPPGIWMQGHEVLALLG